MASTAAKYITLLSGGNYLSTILSTGPVALWPLNDTSGTVATEVVGGLNGTYNNITLANSTFGDGTAAPLFNGTTSYISLPFAALGGVFNTAAGTMMTWQKVSSAAVWTSGTVAFTFTIGTADFNNRVYLFKNSIANAMGATYTVTGSALGPGYAKSVTTWFMTTLTWDKAAGECYLYDNATQGANAGTVGNWEGALAATFSAIGNYTPAAVVGGWNGWLRNAALWNRALTPAEVASLYVSSFAV